MFAGGFRFLNGSIALNKRGNPVNNTPPAASRTRVIRGLGFRHCPTRQVTQGFPELRRGADRLRAGVLSQEHQNQTLAFVKAKEGGVPEPGPRADDGLGNARTPQRHRRRERSGHQLHADRSRAPDRGSGAAGQPAALDDRHASSSIWAGSCAVRRTAVVGRG
jgi:hypothetical protein